MNLQLLFVSRHQYPRQLARVMPPWSLLIYHVGNENLVAGTYRRRKID